MTYSRGESPADLYLRIMRCDLWRVHFLDPSIPVQDLLEASFEALLFAGWTAAEIGMYDHRELANIKKYPPRTTQQVTADLERELEAKPEERAA